ncbi:MAG: hypothetical protein RL291_1192, partial [Pseudomonadota bacterium]
WPQGFKLSLAVIADLHASEPTMGLERIRDVVRRTNALSADAILLLGDYTAGHKPWREPIHSADWGRELGALKAPLGVHAVLGNHDWWDDRSAQRRGAGPTFAGQALESNGIPVYDNQAVRLSKRGRPFWLAGLGDQLALLRGRHDDGRWRLQGVHDLPGTLRQVTDDAPVVLMAHEPDIFTKVPSRVALTISGHTHGGQIRPLGYAIVPGTRLGRRYSYGHVVDDNRHLIVSGGLGCSILPIRFGIPPEIVLIELGA